MLAIGLSVSMMIVAIVADMVVDTVLELVRGLVVDILVGTITTVVGQSFHGISDALWSLLLGITMFLILAKVLKVVGEMVDLLMAEMRRG